MLLRNPRWQGVENLPLNFDADTPSVLSAVIEQCTARDPSQVQCPVSDRVDDSTDGSEFSLQSFVSNSKKFRVEETFNNVFQEICENSGLNALFFLP